MALDEPSTSFSAKSVLTNREHTSNNTEPRGYRPCQYVSNLLIQCKNYINDDCTTANTSQKPEATDELSHFCDKHVNHINAIRAHAKKTRSVIDPGYKPVNRNEDDELFEDLRLEGLHVYDPCCSESYINSSENPLRMAVYMTDKEVARQYDMALERTLEKLKCMRELVLDRFKEHIKSKPTCKKEQRKYKLVVRNQKEKAILERLRNDKLYGVPGPLVLPYIEKAERKHAYEKKGVKVPSRMWLTDPGRDADTFKCDFVEKTEITPDANAQYRSQLLYNASTEDTVVSVINSIVDYVERRNGGVKETKCSRMRVPMTDYCTNHIHQDPQQKIFVKCKQCSNYCLPLEDGYCKLHVVHRRPAILPMAPVVHPHATTSVVGTQLTNGPPQKIQKVAMNGWRQSQLLEPSLSVRADYTLSPVPKTEQSKPERKSATIVESNDLNLNFPKSSVVQVISRKPVPLPGRRLLKVPALLPETVYNVEQKKLALEDGSTIIDEDVPLDELEKQVKSAYEEKRVSGNGVANGPASSFHYSRVVDNRVLQRNRTHVPATIQTGSSTIRQQSIHSHNLAFDFINTSARTRPFMSSDETKALARQTELMPPQPRRTMNRGGRRNVMVRPQMPMTRPRTLQYAHPVMPSINPPYCIQPPTVSNIVRHASPLTTSGNGVRPKTPISYVKNGSKNVAVHALTR
ncbi:unnamed protein product [Bursaphelenchus okinawaensis]|uniref:KANL2-like probable zinc-finger domain-containing protein n=1 Tax=Bursaphelenchus okinawaensis TaxID=465554 RepID=A0A811LAB5_9BILA|nr:unnamed protein product [Bursaphelenchus okinawaensis]CAG9119606.1 unnamed protein product [Bursaphelenchus okinawaensis]